jgi:hypothetical protein
MSEKQRYYASLVGPLVGLYYPMPSELSYEQCHHAMNTSKLAKLWCAIYTEEQVDGFLVKYGGQKLNSVRASTLDYDWDTVHGPQDIVVEDLEVPKVILVDRREEVK